MDNKPLIEDYKENVTYDKSINRKSQSFQFNELKPIELVWSQLVVTAKVVAPIKIEGKTQMVTQQKVLLNRIKGVLRPNQFTAFLGPSGSGKTTLINFLAGRLTSPNMSMTGELRLNGERINSVNDYADRIGYVTQDDVLFSTMTPLESFQFTADLKLKLTAQEKSEKIQEMIRDLGLQNCANTIIGNALMRGISGGEKKRVSIGVELLLDPSIIFLDEPTTGLDSATALQVIELLTALASSGRTVVSSIHQPSSEIFSKFDKLLLIVQGNIIYQGEARNSLKYFSTLGFPCPKYNNPSDFFMKMMNVEGLRVEMMQKQKQLSEEQVKFEYESRMEMFVASYKSSTQYSKLQPIETTAILKTKKKYQSSWWTQFSQIFKRTFISQLRNPIDAKLKVMQYVIYGFLILMVFGNLGSEQTRIKNTSGLMFFISITCCFAAVNSTLPVFSSQKTLYIKERYNYYYTVSAYFWGKSLSELPFQIFYPMILVTMVYFAVGLSLDPLNKYPILILDYAIVYWHASSYGLVLSVLVPRIEIAMTIVPLFSVTFLSCGGYFTTQNTIPFILYPFKYLSFFRYGFEAGMMNEFGDQTVPCGAAECDPLKQYRIEYYSLWIPLLIQFMLGVFIRCVAWLGLYLLSKPKNLKLQSTGGSSVAVMV